MDSKIEGLVEKLNQLRPKGERRMLVHSICVDDMQNMDKFCIIRSGVVYEMKEHPENSDKVILDDRYIAGKDHFLHLSCKAD